MRRPRNVDEYIELIRQAVFEVHDLRSCLEYEIEDLERFPAFLEPLEQRVEALYKSMSDGSYQWGREDLPFMAIVRKNESEIPFVQLLELINETHRHGLEIVDEDQS